MSFPAATAFAAFDQTVVDSALAPIVANVINPLIGLAFAVAVFMFAYGVIQMIMHETGDEARTKGKWTMIGGVIGMTIMLSAWGIIGLVSNTVGQFK
jgi:hypothetical protein